MYATNPSLRHDLLDDTAIAAIACNVALGLNLERAVRKAARYVEVRIETSSDLGKGSGPINHFHSLKILPFSR